MSKDLCTPVCVYDTLNYIYKSKMENMYARKSVKKNVQKKALPPSLINYETSCMKGTLQG